MSKKGIALSISILLIGVLVFNYFSSFSEKMTKSTNLSHESIGGVKIHNNINNSSFITQYDKPLSERR